MATKPAGKKFRSGTIGELADDVYAEINAINAGAASWDSIVTSAAAADSAIDFNDQQITGVSVAGGIGQSIATNTTALETIQAAVAIAALTDNSGGVADDTIEVITEVNANGSADFAPTQAAIADLAAKVNAIRTALVDAGILA